MIKTTRWRPDTCGCIIEYTWDTDEPQDTRKHTLKTIIPCEAHKGLTDGVAYEKVRLENRMVGRAIAGVLEATALEREDISYRFDSKRVLEISSPKFSALQKATLQTVVESIVGEGLVRIL